jgi:SAM-dependent methyltransferase
MSGYRPVQLLKDAAKNALPDAYARYLRWQYARVPLAARIAPILASDSLPTCYDEHFEKLQYAYTKWWPEYGYDAYSTWARGCERAMRLMSIPQLRAFNLAVLEAGCGDGMTSHALASCGNGWQVTLNDVEDWRDRRAQSLPFAGGDIGSRISLESDSFDLVLTYNTFEHLEQPKEALTELVRLCKSGGYIYIEFSPLFCSPLGLHAFCFLMPYPQFLFSPEFVEMKVKELGVNDLGHQLRRLQPTNRWRIAQFRDVWRTSGCDVIFLTETVDETHLSVVAQFPAAFHGRGLTVDDLTINAVFILLRKR